MTYDFTTIMDRSGKDALAVDSIGADVSWAQAPTAPKEGFSKIPMWVADMNFATVPTIPQQIIKRAEHEMRPDNQEVVKVELQLQHGDARYTLTREQTYKKDYNNRIKPINTQFDIAKKDANGNTSFVKRTQCEVEVKSILPKELSKYFFFDGERIEKMSKDISSNRKSDDFAEAVKGLLGLNGMISAIEHFNPRKSNSVIGLYNNSFNSKSNEKIQQFTDDINRCKARLEEIDEELEIIDNDLALAESRKKEKSALLKQYAESEKLQKRREELEKKIRSANKSISLTNRNIVNEFNDKSSSFFSLSLFKRAMDVISNSEFEGKDALIHLRNVAVLPM